MTPAKPPDSNDPRILFEYFSSEYAQALQAFAAIEQQAATLLLMGHSEELRSFIDQFVEMAGRTAALAVEKNEPNFGEWFKELIQRAEALRAGAAK